MKGGKGRCRLVIPTMIVAFLFCEVAASVQVNVMNRLGEGKSLNLHCQSKDNDLGNQTVSDGSEFGWQFSAGPSTLFYCDMGWEGVDAFHFDAFTTTRDWARCRSRCFWLISQEGVYGLNDSTGLWEYMYFWPN